MRDDTDPILDEVEHVLDEMDQVAFDEEDKMGIHGGIFLSVALFLYGGYCFFTSGTFPLWVLIVTAICLLAVVTSQDALMESEEERDAWVNL